MKKLDNRGFTLVELLAVVAIIVIIMGIAIPNISSSIERSNAKKDKAMEKVIKSAGELYVSKYKSTILEKSQRCYINVSTLIEEGYLNGDDLGEHASGCLEYKNKALTYVDSCSGNPCVG